MKKPRHPEFAHPEAHTSPDSKLASGAAPGAKASGDEEVVSERGLRWQNENEAAIACYNRWVAEHGLPLEEFRRF